MKRETTCVTVNMIAGYLIVFDELFIPPSAEPERVIGHFTDSAGRGFGGYVLLDKREAALFRSAADGDEASARLLVRSFLRRVRSMGWEVPSHEGR